ncbi:MAG: tail fiber protein [Bacillota bacterium]
MDSDFLRLARRIKVLEETPAEVSEEPAPLRITGEMTLWPGGTAPQGWLLCDGSPVSRTDYAALFAVIGTTYGGGDGSATFNIPNLKGRAVVGQNTADTSFNTLGVTGGEKAHILTASEMPVHSHTLTVGSGGAHAHSIRWYNGEYISLSGSGSGDSSSGYRTGYSSGTVYHSATLAASAGAHTHTASASNAGGGSGHNNMPPYIVLNYIIKT